MSAYSVAVRKMLLRDQTTGKNIIWADHEYEHFGEGYAASDEITLGRIRYGHGEIVKPRFTKELERQSSRTKSRAEVFTPSWLVNRMNNYFDEVWFGQKEIFNTEAERDWVVNEHPVSMPDNANRNWRQYVTSTRLEITCGEAPFICSRYDTVSGFRIQVSERIGVLDRKLRIISEHTKTRATWVRWAFEAVKATYGYEYQGDNLLIARINVLETVREHLVGRWREGLSERETEELARIISWNFWQMNGLTDAPPTDAESMIEYPLFEQENPGCFDDPEYTFADLYMKSGLYITEVIKRLYNSERMRELFPDNRQRLDHIFERQVFGIAPSEIIYRIATHFILGFNDEIGNGCKTNFVIADSAKLAKEGKLAAFVEQTFRARL